MPLDFNTLEVKDNEKTVSRVSSIEDGVTSGRFFSAFNFTPILIGLCTILSIASLVLGLFSIKNTPKSAPISIECDPDLLKKIENQARVLDQIAKTAKTSK